MLAYSEDDFYGIEIACPVIGNRKSGRFNRKMERVNASVRRFVLLLAVITIMTFLPTVARAYLCPEAVEEEVAALINTERANQGLPPLEIDVRLVEAARLHSEDMATNDFFSHTGSDGSSAGERITRAGYIWTTYAENIAAGYQTASAAVQAWMQSPGHRANILSPSVDHIGVGYAYNPNSYYGTYWTADFGASSSAPLTPADACVSCTPEYAEVVPGWVNSYATAGNNPPDEIVSIRDNCGNDLSYTIETVTGTFIWSPLQNDTGTGSLNISFDASSLSSGNYNGSIEILPDGFPAVTLPVNLLVYDPGVLALLSPNGGDSIPSGGSHTIQWSVPQGAVSFDLEYSVNAGNTWRPLAGGLTGSSYDWAVPVVAGNKRKALVRVTAYDGNGSPARSDTSDAWFRIEVVSLRSPDGGESYNRGDPVTIYWDTNETKTPITKVVLKYHQVGGTGWNLITVINGSNPGSYIWTIPAGFTPGDYRLKINLWDGNKNRRGADKSDGAFQVQ